MTNKKEKVFDLVLFKRLFKFIKPYTSIFYIAFITVIGLSVFSAIRPKILQLAIDDNIKTKNPEGFITYILVILSILILEVICNFLFIYYANWLGQTVVKDIRVKLFKHILNFKMKYYDNSSVGVLITRAVTDMERIADIFSQGLFMIFSDLLKMSIVACVMLYMNWRLSIIIFLALPIVIFATKIFQKYMKKAFEEVRAEVANLNSFVQERVTGMKILQLFTRENIEYKKFKTINARHKKGWLKTVKYNAVFFPIAELTSSIALGLVVWYGGFDIASENKITTLGNLTAFIMFTPMIFRPLHQIANKFNTLIMGMVAADRVFKVLDTKSNIDNSGTITNKKIKGDITFKNVEFSYTNKEKVLKGISFKANAGETIAIVGSTGAGKSTIINLLNRFYDISSGQIAIDNTNIKDLKLNVLRDQIAVVLQDVFLFADSILNNITLNNPNITENTVIEAAKKIGLHDFISNLPNGYQYNVKERGAMLSSGQRQLISFLRAYVTNPSILVLDEATSSVDSHSEQLIQKATNTITKGRTSIVIAHRLDTIKKADKIIVMDSGTIVEQGTHHELLNIKNGFYKNLYEVQFANN